MGKIMKDGKQYGVGGTQQADEIVYGTGTVESALNTLNDKRILFETVSGTTTASGALEWPNRFTTTYQLLSARSTSGNNIFAFARGDGYLTVFTVTNNALTVLANTAVTFEVAYCKK